MMITERATGSGDSSILQRLSPRLTASAAGLIAVGAVTGLISYLDRSPAREAHIPGTSAWIPHLVLAAAACTLYGLARWRGGRGPLLLLAPLGHGAASRLAATMRRPAVRPAGRPAGRRSWRAAAALPPLAMIGYGLWRTGEQITAGLDPNFTVNAWGGPTYLGAMACHYLDGGLIIAACAWLLNRILIPVGPDRSR
ncbi:MAG: hypothetical protein J2P26_05470 [Nocardiopsaceae bacterium]|nr:hypothetical protein [Nocardiopsaceae bacterium]